MESKTTILDTCVDIAARELHSLLEQVEEGVSLLRAYPWWEYSKGAVVNLYNFHEEVEAVLWDLITLSSKLEYNQDEEAYDKGTFLREFKELKPVAEQVIEELKEWKE